MEKRYEYDFCMYVRCYNMFSWSNISSTERQIDDTKNNQTFVTRDIFK